MPRQTIKANESAAAREFLPGGSGLVLDAGPYSSLEASMGALSNPTAATLPMIWKSVRKLPLVPAVAVRGAAAADSK